MSPRISISNFDKLIKAHLAALEADNHDGSLTSVQQDTQALYEDFVKQQDGKTTSASLRKGQTENVDSLIVTVRDFIAEQEPNIAYQFRKEPGKYAEFYPNGLTEYRRAKKDNLVTLFTRFVTACIPYPDKVGKEVISQAQQLSDSLKKTRSGQVQKKETVKNLSGTAAVSQQALAIRLYRTLGLLISIHAEQPETVDKFFDFSFLPKSVVKKVSSGVTTPIS